MKNLMEKLYGNLDEAKAFVIDFEYMIFTNQAWDDLVEITCQKCGKYYQKCDYQSTKSECKKAFGKLDLEGFGICEDLKNELITNFDISEEDFRPIRNKIGTIIYYQITPTHTMLPNSKIMDWHYEPCLLCKSEKYWRKSKYNENKEEYYYISQEVLDDLHDINVSHEQFSMYAPIYVVSKRVYEYFAEHYPRAKFSPMFLKQDN